jgi:hypothetical protein
MNVYEQEYLFFNIDRPSINVNTIISVKNIRERLTVAGKLKE